MPTPPIYQVDELRKRGIKTSAQSSRQLLYVGKLSQLSFEAAMLRMLIRFTPTNTDVASLGEVYKTGYYQKTAGSIEKTYEPVFDKYDWSKAAEDPSTLRLLEEFYGNFGDVSESEVANQRDMVNVYSSTTATINSKPFRELSATLAASRAGLKPQTDVDTKGIRGVDELNAPIDPYA